MTARQPTKVAIVGAGRVGATATYALLLSGLAVEIVLIDANHNPS
jgi:L-lactate dehydrogenase